MELRTGDKISTKYHTRTITSIIDDKITLDDGCFYADDIRGINVSLLGSAYRSMINTLESFEKEYRFVVCDLYNNIAVSKIPQSEYNKRYKEARNKNKFYAKHVKLLYHTQEFKDDNPEVLGELLHPIINDYFGKLGLFLWYGLTSNDLANLISTMYLFGDKYDEEPSLVYKDVIFIND